MDVKYECCDMNLHVAVIKPQLSLTQATKVEVEDPKRAHEQDAKLIERNIRSQEEDDGGGGGCYNKITIVGNHQNNQWPKILVNESKE
ncbi:hypothetical protein GOBAR_AA05029 [Gossypium barbadense]|uniref:Uncharacterized protein n=1 Tax=Gossypium barbadense TaxID=3634 RepID=A0A2P5YIX0_GOSBA|nr:hypothetical protein GOBAR_AA05029 [Gossypium barbadense]